MCRKRTDYCWLGRKFTAIRAAKAYQVEKHYENLFITNYVRLSVRHHGLRFGQNPTPNSIEERTESSPNIENANSTNISPANSERKAAPISVATVAGSYKYEIDRKGKRAGYVNYLAVENKGNGVLAVYFNAASIYEANGAESSHETSAEGNLTLRGNIASGKITDDDGEGESGAPCAVTITFAANQATVKSAAGCYFSASIDGVYKKEKSKPKSEEKKQVAHVEYDRLKEYINGKHRSDAGEAFVVENVPMIKSIESTDKWDIVPPQGEFALTFGDSDDGVSFFAADDLVKVLRPKLKTEVHHLRVECVLIIEEEPAGDYHSVFATAVEAVDAEGKSLWRVMGAKPKRVRI